MICSLQFCQTLVSYVYVSSIEPDLQSHMTIYFASSSITYIQLIYSLLQIFEQRSLKGRFPASDSALKPSRQQNDRIVFRPIFHSCAFQEKIQHELERHQYRNCRVVTIVVCHIARLYDSSRCHFHCRVASFFAHYTRYRFLIHYTGDGLSRAATSEEDSALFKAAKELPTHYLEASVASLNCRFCSLGEFSKS